MTNKNLCYLMVIFFLHSFSMYAIFDFSPWMIIENKTPFTVTCVIEVMHEIFKYQPAIHCDVPEKYIFDIEIETDTVFSDNGKAAMLYTLTLSCQPYQTYTLPALFYKEDQPYAPTINDIIFTQETLQITTVNTIEQQNFRHFTLQFDNKYGIHIESNPITFYVQCISNTKKYLHAFLSAMMHSVNRLPY